MVFEGFEVYLYIYGAAISVGPDDESDLLGSEVKV